MAKVTDRYENENLIKLAKKQYTDKKISKLPSEIVNIPSNGLIYSIDSPLREGHVELRHMTAYDEDILTNSSYISEGVVLDKLIDSLIITDVNYNDIAQVDKDGLVLNARILSYGSEYPVTFTDPKTKKQIKQTVDLSKIQSKTIDIESNDQGEFTYETESLQIKFKFLTNNKSNKTISEYLSNIITEVNGKRKQSEIDNFIRYEFLVKDSKDFQKFILNNTPSLILEYEFQGEDGSAFTAGFPVGPDFFWI